MKNGICPMCQSTEVYMTEDIQNLAAGEYGLRFRAEAGREKNFFNFKTYVCLDCGYTAMFAKAEFQTKDNPGLSLLKKAAGWKKAG